MAKITLNDVKSFVHQWFARLDRLDGETELLDMLAADNLEMNLGSAPLTSREEFADWYDDIRRRFAENVHHVGPVRVRRTGENRFQVEFTVLWDALMKKGNPFQVEAREEWTVEADTDGKLRISRYAATEIPAGRLSAA